MLRFSNRKPKIKEINKASVANEIRLYELAASADQYDRLRAIENFILYAPTNDWQTFDAASAFTLDAENRDPNYYNFMQVYVNGNAGNFIANRVDPKFVDRSDDDTDTSEAIEALTHAWYSDKEHFKYKESFVSSVVNGCVYRGVEEISIVRTEEEPRGRIKFESLSPISIIFDPSNLTDNIAKGSKNAWKRFYLTPKEILNYYPHATEDVKIAINNLSENKGVFESRNSEYPEQDFWNNKYQIVEHFHIKTKNKKIAYDNEEMVKLPETGHPFGSEEDWIAKKEWAMGQGFILEPENIETIVIQEEELWVTTICKSLGVVLENRKDERQMKGADGHIMLPFVTWSYVTKNGKSIGLVDIGKPMQKDINKREAQKTKILTQTPVGGKTFIHPMAYGEDIQKKEDLVKNYTDPSKPVFLDEDAPPGLNLIYTQNGSQLNPAIFQDETAKIQFMDKILHLSPAMQGAVGKSGESGLLFGRKVVEGNVMLQVPQSTIEQYENAKFEMWAILALKFYVGKTKEEKEMNYDRVFAKADGTTLKVNELVGIDENGNDIIKNDLSKITRLDVVISQQKDNDYVKQSKRELDIAYLQALPESPTSSVYRAIASADLAKNMDGMTIEQKELVDKVSKMTVDYAIKQLMVGIKGLEMQLAQSQQGIPQGNPQQNPNNQNKGVK